MRLLIAMLWMAMLSNGAYAWDGVTVAPVTLDIYAHGKIAGSTTIPAGRKVVVIEESGSRTKISISPEVSGWVDRNAVEFSDKKRIEPGGHAEGGKAPTTAVSFKVSEQKQPKGDPNNEKFPCHGMGHALTFQPNVSFGAGTQGTNALVRFYLLTVVGHNDKESVVELERAREDAMARSQAEDANLIDYTQPGKELDKAIKASEDKLQKELDEIPVIPKQIYETKVTKFNDIPVPADGSAMEPVSHKYMEWHCKCCRALKNGEYIGWYAELISDGKVISKAESPMEQPVMEVLQGYLQLAAANIVPVNDAASNTEGRSKTPKNHNKPWTAQEETLLKEASEKGLQIEEIASLMVRTPNAISKRLKKLGDATRTALSSGTEVTSEMDKPEAVTPASSPAAEMASGMERSEAVKVDSSPGAEMASGAHKLEALKLTIQGHEVLFKRWGEGDKAVVFFSHTGPMNMAIADDVSAFRQLVEGGYSLFTWDYPKDVSPFSQIDKTLEKMMRSNGRGASLNFSGIASSIVKELRDKYGIKDVILVGNSLGAGMLLWDYKKLATDPAVRLVLISPTSIFSPPVLDFNLSKNDLLIANEEKDFFITGTTMKQWVAKNKFRGTLQNPPPSDGHIIVGENLSCGAVAELASLATRERFLPPASKPAANDKNGRATENPVLQAKGSSTPDPWSGEPWTEEDKAFLKGAFERGGQIDTIADQMRRTPNAIYRQLRKQGLIK